MIAALSIRTPCQGLHEITRDISQIVQRSGAETGLCTIFLRHTSASLIIQENADPSARKDLERWINRLVPEKDEHFTHTAEGPDDMPSHIKTAITASSLSIPIIDGELATGTWQGIYIWEHRRAPHTRQLVVHVLAD